MILKASQRGGAKQLAVHLLSDENEHVTVHEIKGCVSDTLPGALQEMYAISKATQCKKFLFSLSLNPPQQEIVETDEFDATIERIEKTLGIENQPRCVVFHEKEGRRHAHCVWSRIDGENIKAIKLPYFKKKLNALAKELYLEHGWQLPEGFESPGLSDPTNFNLAEWQQAKRSKVDPRELKSRLRQCWQHSDDKGSFTRYLKEAGFYLARGDRRGFVAMDWHGEVYSLSRMTGQKRKALEERLGSAAVLPSVTQTKRILAQHKRELHQKLENELTVQQQEAIQPLQTRRLQLLSQAREQRQTLKRQHEQRWQAEQTARQQTIRTGLGGL